MEATWLPGGPIGSPHGSPGLPWETPGDPKDRPRSLGSSLGPPRAAFLLIVRYVFVVFNNIPFILRNFRTILIMSIEFRGMQIETEKAAKQEQVTEEGKGKEEKGNANGKGIGKGKGKRERNKGKEKGMNLGKDEEKGK